MEVKFTTMYQFREQGDSSLQLGDELVQRPRDTGTHRPREAAAGWCTRPGSMWWKVWLEAKPRRASSGKPRSLGFTLGLPSSQEGSRSMGLILMHSRRVTLTAVRRTDWRRGRESNLQADTSP